MDNLVWRAWHMHCMLEMFMNIYIYVHMYVCVLADALYVTEYVYEFIHKMYTHMCLSWHGCEGVKPY